MFDLFPPGTSELDTITDFISFLGVAEIDGTSAGDNAGLSFEVDNRFITRGVHRTGQAALQRTFGFFWAGWLPGAGRLQPNSRLHPRHRGKRAVLHHPGPGLAGAGIAGQRASDMDS